MTRRNYILTILLSALFFLNGVCVSAQRSFSSEERKSYQKAIALAEKTNYREAVAILRVMFDAHPDNIDVAYNLGLCYMNMSGNPDSALFFFNKVRLLDKTRGWTDSKVELLLAIGRTQQLCGDPEGALATYHEIESSIADTSYASIISQEKRICNNAIIFMKNPVHLEFKKIGNSVNSSFNDYRPVLSISEDTLYFTSRRYKPDANRRIVFDDGQFEEGVYMSVRNGDKWTGSWSPAEQVKGLCIDKKGNAGQETVTSIATYQGVQELYLCHDGDIYVSKRDTSTNEWQPAEALPAPINTVYVEEAAFVTPDGTEMYFSSDCPGGFGGKDIYLSRRLPKGTWGEPVNLGQGVNTDEDEDAPFYHAPTNVLYFSSRGHNTMGGYDIFVSPKCDDGCFEAVQNLGYPINSADDDLYFFPSKDHDRAFYASIRWNEGASQPSFNVYEVEYEQPEQNRMALVAASVEAPDVRDVAILTKHEGQVIGICYPNERTGRFVSIVEAGYQYELVAVSGKDTITQSISTTKADSYYHRKSPIELDSYVFSDQLRAAAENNTVNQNGASQAAGFSGGNSGNSDDPADFAPAGAANSDSPYQSWVTSQNKPYTVQILSLRRRAKVSSIKGLETDSIAEYVYKDGWYVYSYGSYATYSEAVKSQIHIRRVTPYKDAFSRNSNQYRKFLKKDDDGTPSPAPNDAKVKSDQVEGDGPVSTTKTPKKD